MAIKKCNCHFCGKDLIRKVMPSIKSKLHFCNIKCKGEYQKTFKPVTKEWLYEHYIVKKMDTTQIGYIVKRDPKSVWNWLKDFNIPTRGRGTDKRQHFVKGQVNPFLGRKHTQETKDKLRKIALADGRLPFKKENGPPYRGKRGAETSNWKGGITPERQSFYSSEEWSHTVKKIWKRDNAYCQRCGKTHNKLRKTGDFHIHHITSFMVKDLRMDINNLVLFCKECHRWVHSRKNKNKEFLSEVTNGS